MPLTLQATSLAVFFTVTMADIIALAILSVILVLYFSLFYRTLLYIGFDESYARTYSRNVDLLKYITIALVSLTVVLNIRMAGIVLVISLLTIPPNTVMLFTPIFKRIIVWSVIVGFAGIISGLVFSYFAAIPAGAAIIFAQVIIWAILRLVRFIIPPRERALINN